MTTLVNFFHENNRMNHLQDKSMFQTDGSYRIFHVTSRSRDDSDDETEKSRRQTEETIGKDEGKRRKFSKKSFRLSHRGGVNGWKRKSTRNKRLNSPPQSSCTSSTNDNKHLTTVDPSSHVSSRSINSNDRPGTLPLSSKEKRGAEDEDGTHLTDADLLIGHLNETTAHDDATLHNLLARADQLESNLKKQDFSKIQLTARASFTRKRKRSVIILSIITLVIIALIILLSVVAVLMTMRYKRRINPILATTSPSS